jgi:hypothetical protein
MWVGSVEVSVEKKLALKKKTGQKSAAKKDCVVEC